MEPEGAVGVKNAVVLQDKKEIAKLVVKIMYIVRASSTF
jgi:hypothetical protein